MNRTVWTFLIALAVSVPAVAGSPKTKKPDLELRATPRFGFSPLNVLLTAELEGGSDVEEYYCPEIEWEWGDGGKSVREADCPPFEAGTKIQRRFTERHEYRRAGKYRVKVTLSRSDDALAADTVEVTVRAGLGDPTFE